MGKFIDLTGKVFGRLTVVSRVLGKHYKNGRGTFWLCRCTCNKEIMVTVTSLRTENTQSCGCLCKQRLRETHTTHGRSHGGEYQSWEGMKGRCNNPLNKKYPSYGGRGIAVCERWETFQNFLEDMGPRPKGTSIDRINNNGNYEPGNCRWATRIVQQRNKRDTRLLTIKNATLPIIEWCERIGMHYSTLINRINRGWPPEEALYTPVRQRTKPQAN